MESGPATLLLRAVLRASSNAEALPQVDTS